MRWPANVSRNYKTYIEVTLLDFTTQCHPGSFNPLYVVVMVFHGDGRKAHYGFIANRTVKLYKRVPWCLYKTIPKVRKVQTVTCDNA
ncbi:hypothetical protein X801_04869 [Opisthorchis viverrini]|uniref:Uncharacterized protein n=1 Tax=Opisthorchis viverrini TaxID=6198 RepID=A0A1S8WXT8_OPIVI|nr:hypothetical protein X801_04869 [Opisthorchis viverrini]